MKKNYKKIKEYKPTYRCFIEGGRLKFYSTLFNLKKEKDLEKVFVYLNCLNPEIIGTWNSVLRFSCMISETKIENSQYEISLVYTLKLSLEDIKKDLDNFMNNLYEYHIGDQKNHSL